MRHTRPTLTLLALTLALLPAARAHSTGVWTFPPDTVRIAVTYWPGDGAPPRTATITTARVIATLAAAYAAAPVLPPGALMTCGSVSAPPPHATLVLTTVGGASATIQAEGGGCLSAGGPGADTRAPAGRFWTAIETAMRPFVAPSLPRLVLYWRGGWRVARA